MTDEVAAWKAAGITTIVSLLTPKEQTELELISEAELCRRAGIQWTELPIVDRGVPDSRDQFDELVRRIAHDLSRGGSILVHCRQGIGRSALVAGGVLTALGARPQEALDQVAAARQLPVPETEEQLRWFLQPSGKRLRKQTA